MECERCGNEHNGSFATGRFCNRSCANGRTWSKQDKLKKSESAFKSEKILATKLYPNKFCLKCNVKISRHSVTNMCKPHSFTDSVYREKLSEARSRNIEEKGNGGFLDIKYYNTQNTMNENFKVRGTWERKMAQWLTTNGVEWKRKVYLKYIKQGEDFRRTYSPDFFLPEDDLYIEVKGYYSQLDKEKMERVIEQNNINLLMIFGRHLREFGEISTVKELKVLSKK